MLPKENIRRKWLDACDEIDQEWISPVPVN
jgi:hypothetical protein